MSEDPRDVAAGPSRPGMKTFAERAAPAVYAGLSSGSSDDSKTIDQVMLLALSHHPRDRTPLSPDQERLLDRWVAGHLPSADGARAAMLTQQNEFAAERVLERRLVTSAEEGPTIPTVLANRVLTMSKSSQGRTDRGVRWRLSGFGAWQFLISGVAIAALILLTLSMPFWRQPPSSANQSQFALVTVGDRNVLSSQVDIPLSVPAPVTGQANASQDKALGTTKNLNFSNNIQLSPKLLETLSKETMRPPTVTSSRFRDIDAPMALLRVAIAKANGDSDTVTNPELIAMLTPPGTNNQRGVRLLIDMAIVDAVKESPGRTSLPVRLYDLEDEHTALILENLGGVSSIGHLMLLTVVP